jgi:hypothetical protein
LLIDEGGSNYTFIDPHWPNTLKAEPKDIILKSNAAADEGPGFSKQEKVGQTTKRGWEEKTYDLGNPQHRQSLRNLLVSVY